MKSVYVHSHMILYDQTQLVSASNLSTLTECSAFTKAFTTYDFVMSGYWKTGPFI